MKTTISQFSPLSCVLCAFCRSLRIAGVVLAVACAIESPGATLSWSGAGATGNWNDSGNWGFAGTPAVGDTLIFSAAQPRLNNTNNIVGLTLNQVRFVGASGGYAIFGNAITVTNGIEATNSTGLNVISNSITLGSPTNFVVNVATGAKLFLGGTLSGSVGLIKTGGGTNTLGGGFSNTYGGPTTVSNGIVELSKFGSSAAAIPHDLIIGNGTTASTVRNLAGSEIADVGNVTVNRLSTWDLNDFNDTISILTLSGGSVDTGIGTLTLGGNVTSLSSLTTATITGHLSLGGVTRTFSVSSGSASPDLLIAAVISGGPGAGVTKTGSGQLTLSGANTYTGVTTIDGFVILANNSALGANGFATNGTTLNSNALLFVQGVDIGDEFLALTTGDDFRSSGTASWAGPVTLNGDVFINVFGGTFTNSGAITGTGGVTKGQGGTLIYAGSGINGYSGDTIVSKGELQLAKTVGTAGIVNGTLTIGDDIGASETNIVREMGPNQINSSVAITIHSSGLLDLNNFNDALGALTFSGGHLTTGTGTATLAGNITANPNTNNLGRIDGHISQNSTRTYNVVQGNWSPDFRVTASVSGAGGITKIGAGEMSLTGSNSYSGLTIVSAGLVNVQNDFALGATNSGTVVSNGAYLAVLSDTHVGAEPLTLNGSGYPPYFGVLHGSFGSNSWDGPITLGTNSTISVYFTNDFLNLSGPISGTGDLTKIGPGTLIFSGSTANKYSGSTFMSEGTLQLSKSVVDGGIPHDLFIGDGVGPSLSDIVRLTDNAQIATVSDVIITNTGLFDLNEITEGISTLSGSGRVDLGSTGNGGIVLNGSGSTTYSGLIIGTGGDLTKNSTGTFTLSGNNTYSGLTRVNGGRLIVNGSQPQSPVVIGASGTLGGSGTVGNVTNTLGGIVAPGASPAMLTTSNAIFSGVTSDFTVELNGTTPDAGYDQINARGLVSLGGATLNLTTAFGPSDAPVEGTQFIIINNDGADAVSGTFAGLANGSIVTVGNLKFVLSYNGGTGNDVVLTVTNTALDFVSSAISSGNGDGIIQPNECNLLNIVITNTSGAAVTNISATLVSGTPGVTVVQDSSAYPNLSANARGTNSTSFQLSVAPTFICGANIELTLVVSTANQGTFGIPLVLNSGAAGTATSFSNLGIRLVPDGGSTNSTVTVSGLTAPIAKVTVSLNINHGSDSDLDIFLQGPDGTIVELSTDNGGPGNNYGNSCAQRTTFDDAAVTAITSGAPPFFASFRPEGKLSDFRGKSGADANGTWTLLVSDDTANAIGGELDCWTLTISQATCVPGGGICEFCPAVTLNGALGTNSLQENPRLTRNGIASTCGVLKACPGPFGLGNHSYDAYTFKNGATNACITVTLTAPLSDVFSAAYINSFDPSNLCANYLADAGDGTAGLLTPTTYSFNVAANATFIVTVNEVSTGIGGPYTLDVSGGDCRPALNITEIPGNKVQLDWTTAAAGYGLESANIVPAPTPWPPVTNVPTAFNGRFQVTNNISTTNRFFRLRKPLP